MARVKGSAAAAADRRQARKNVVNRKYKVVFESVTKKQKKLHTVVSEAASIPLPDTG